MLPPMLLIINDLQKRFYISWAPQLFLHFFVYISDFQCFTSTFISFFTHLLMLLKYFTDKIRMHVDNIYESKIIIIMTTNLNYNQLQEWSNSDLIEQILLLQDFINKES